jgi:hypothetical protein
VGRFANTLCRKASDIHSVHGINDDVHFVGSNPGDHWSDNVSQAVCNVPHEYTKVEIVRQASNDMPEM